jgi:hypothetical protein
MICCECQKDFPSLCTCEDKHERLMNLLGNSKLGFLICTGCLKHADICDCEEPEPPRKLMSATIKEIP